MSVAEDRAPIDPQIVRQAMQWHVRLWSGEASDDDRTASSRWRGEHPDHERAWRRLAGLGERLGGIPEPIARHALLEGSPDFAGRRRSLQVLGLGVLAAGVAVTVPRTAGWQRAVADLRTATGETRALTLPDGTQVVLDTATAIDLRYSDRERLILLHGGAVHVTSAPDPAPVHRPLRVRTRHGTAQALGTRFMVRQDDHRSQVSVFEGVVAVGPRQGPAPLHLQAGQGATFTQDAVAPPLTLPAQADAWTRGLLVVEGMRLDDFLRELDRYRGGILGCAPDIAGLRLSGVYPLHDVDLALSAVERNLPVRVHRRFGYWISVRARG